MEPPVNEFVPSIKSVADSPFAFKEYMWMVSVCVPVNLFQSGPKVS